MDTGTHLVVGLGLAGLACIDPYVSEHSMTFAAVLTGTVAGSQAPDTDTLFRFKGNATYIRNHRGKSHSIPAIVFWTLAISLLSWAMFHGASYPHVLLWVFIAVVLHVFSDLFNTYGTQALWPFSEKWISWNIIHIFDPFIFIAHVVALLMWASHVAAPQLIFPVLYTVIVMYYVWRTITHFYLRNRVRASDVEFVEGDKYTIIPTISLTRWNVVKQKTDGQYAVGEWNNDCFRLIENVRCDNHKAVELSKSHPDIRALLYFSSYACANMVQHVWGYEVRWADIRYRHRRQYPFVGVVLMDHNFNIIDSYVGWLSDTRVNRRLGLPSSS